MLPGAIDRQHQRHVHLGARRALDRIGRGAPQPALTSIPGSRRTRSPWRSSRKPFLRPACHPIARQIAEPAVTTSHLHQAAGWTRATGLSHWRGPMKPPGRGCPTLACHRPAASTSAPRTRLTKRCMLDSAGIRRGTALTWTRSHPPHLKALEAESIHILREVAAQAARPVLLYSIGKDSSVLLHLARKAFFPAKPPFPLLHIDTTWKFRDMITLPRRHGEAVRASICACTPIPRGCVRTSIRSTTAAASTRR